jgi:hypothetical protein
MIAIVGPQPAAAHARNLSLSKSESMSEPHKYEESIT